MKWSKLDLLHAPNGMIQFDESITFDQAVFSKMSQIRGLQNVTVSGHIQYEEQRDRAYADLDIAGVMILPCSVTNEDVDYEFHTQSMETFAFEKSNDEDVHVSKGDMIELMPVIFQLILMEIPLKVVKENAQYPQGKGWEVMKEEDYLRSKKDEIDPRLAKLKEFKTED